MVLHNICPDTIVIYLEDLDTKEILEVPLESGEYLAATSECQCKNLDELIANSQIEVVPGEGVPVPDESSSIKALAKKVLELCESNLVKGKDGISVVDAVVDKNYNLILTMSDGSHRNAGYVRGAEGLTPSVELRDLEDGKVEVSIDSIGGKVTFLTSPYAMRTRTYDSDLSGVVDDSERLGGQLPEYYSRATHDHKGTYLEVGQVPNWAMEPKKPAYHRSEIGDLNKVVNERQYSEQNPPPYPVTKVSGKTGDVTLYSADIVDGISESEVNTKMTQHEMSSNSHQDIRGKLNELNTTVGGLTGRVGSLHGVAWTGDYKALKNRPEILGTVVEGSEELVTSQGIFKAISALKVDSHLSEVSEYPVQNKVLTKALAAHTHGNLTRDGKLGTEGGLPVFTGEGGIVQPVTPREAVELLGITEYIDNKFKSLINYDEVRF